MVQYLLVNFVLVKGALGESQVGVAHIHHKGKVESLPSPCIQACNIVCNVLIKCLH